MFPNFSKIQKRLIEWYRISTSSGFCSRGMSIQKLSLVLNYVLDCFFKCLFRDHFYSNCSLAMLNVGSPLVAQVNLIPFSFRFVVGPQMTRHYAITPA
jgi:hypothetical protein